MKNYRFACFMFATMVSISIYCGALATGAPRDKAMKVGKTGEMQLDTEVRIGDLTLMPGHYKFQYRMEGSDHFVRFTELTNMRSGPSKADIREVKCILVPLGAKASETRAYYSKDVDGTLRLIRLEVTGENMVHFFPIGMTNLTMSDAVVGLTR